MASINGSTCVTNPVALHPGVPHSLVAAFVRDIAISLRHWHFQNNSSFTHYLLVPCYFNLHSHDFVLIKVTVQALASQYLNKTVLLDFASPTFYFTRALSRTCALQTVIICLWPWNSLLYYVWFCIRQVFTKCQTFRKHDRLMNIYWVLAHLISEPFYYLRPHSSGAPCCVSSLERAKILLSSCDTPPSHGQFFSVVIDMCFYTREMCPLFAITDFSGTAICSRATNNMIHCMSQVMLHCIVCVMKREDRWAYAGRQSGLLHMLMITLACVRYKRTTVQEVLQGWALMGQICCASLFQFFLEFLLQFTFWGFILAVSLSWIRCKL